VDAAAHIYAELEGAELERSANVFDLSFVPDDMAFDDAYRYILMYSFQVYLLMGYRDEATADPNAAFKAVDFVTDVSNPSQFYRLGGRPDMYLGPSAF